MSAGRELFEKEPPHINGSRFLKAAFLAYRTPGAGYGGLKAGDGLQRLEMLGVSSLDARQHPGAEGLPSHSARPPNKAVIRDWKGVDASRQRPGEAFEHGPAVYSRSRRWPRPSPARAGKDWSY